MNPESVQTSLLYCDEWKRLASSLLSFVLEKGKAIKQTCYVARAHGMF
jgi:hypothetical protein